MKDSILIIFLTMIIGSIAAYFIFHSIYKGRVNVKRLKNSEENFRTLAEKYEAVVGNIREVIFQLDTVGTILYLNHSWEMLTGFSVEESIGKNILDFTLENEWKGMNSQIKAKSLNGELRFSTKNQQSKMVEVTLIPLFDDDSLMNGYTGTIQDISERKQWEYLLLAEKQYVENLNQDLEKRIKQETDKNRQKDHILIQQSRLAAIGEMVANIGHQWCLPLSSLSLLIQDVREAQDFGEINDQYIDRFIKESMVQIKQLTATINDFRKIYCPNKEKMFFSVADAIEDALNIFSFNLKTHDIRIEFEYGGQPTAYGSPNEYSQVVLNILTNSRDAFISRHSQNRMIKIQIIENDETIVAHFIDNAGSIDSKLIEKVFDPYFTTKPQGTGLGLYMTKMIMEGMDGGVRIVNTDDGTSLSLTVPKVSPEEITQMEAG